MKQIPSKELKTNASIWVILGTILSLFLYGFVDNLKGGTLSGLLDELSLSYSAGGAIQQGAYLGFMAASLSTGFLIAVAGHRRSLIFGAVCMAIGMLAYSLFSAFLPLLVFMTVIGLGLGILNLVGVRLITDLQSNEKGKYLNLTALFHGLAAMLAPLYTGRLLAAGFSWRGIYQVSILLVGLYAIYFLVPLRKRMVVHEINLKPIPLRVLFQSLLRARIWAFYAIIFCYEAVEIGFAVWVSEFLQTTRAQSLESSLSALSLFFLFLMIGRLIGSFIVEKIGYLRVLFTASLCAGLCLAIGIFAPAPFHHLLPATGLFLSVLFPTTSAAASNCVGSSDPLQFGWLFTFAGLGGMAGSWVIGALADLSTVQTGFASLIILAFMISLLSFAQIQKLSHKNLGL